MKKGFLYAQAVMISCIAMVLLFASSVSGVLATQNPIVAIEPLTAEIPNLGNFTVVNVTVTDVTNLFGWQIAVHYNTTILNCTAAWLPEGHVFDGQEVAAPDPAIEEDYVAYGCNLINPPTFNGSGVLCSINFTGLAEGDSDLTFGLTGVTVTFLIGYPPAYLPFDVENGSISVIPEFPAFMLVPLFMIVTITAVILRTKGCIRKTKTSRLK